MSADAAPLPGPESPRCPLRVSRRPEADGQTAGGSVRPLLSAVGGAARVMTSGESLQSPAAAAEARGRAAAAMYKALCFLLLLVQGGVLDFYLIVFTDLYWCSWIATDLVLVSGWAIFFLKNARRRRERACGFRQKGCGPGEFGHAYLAWLIYVISCTPKVLLILETSILHLVALKVPFGLSGFKAVLLLSAPLLFCLLGAVAEDPGGPGRQRARGCFLATCLDLLDAFALLEVLLGGQMPAAYLQHAVVGVYWLTLAAPVLWLHELAAPEPGRGRRCVRLLLALLVNGPLLLVRCLLVFGHDAGASTFLFKNVFFCSFQLLELLEECACGFRGSPAHLSHRVSDSDVCPHGYVNSLAVAQS